MKFTQIEDGIWWWENESLYYIVTAVDHLERLHFNRMDVQI